MSEIADEINRLHRRVGTRQVETGEARTVLLRRTYDAEIADVWDAVTSPERIARWFMPVSGELKVGGRYQLEGNAGGEVQRCEPPRFFAVTWEFGGGVSWVEVTLDAEPEERTRFTLEHIAHVSEHWEEYGPGAVGIGWDLGLLGLGRHLGSGSGPTPEEAMAWYGSAEGREFVTLSGEQWFVADVAGGEEPADARARADRTTAAYTG